MTDPDPGPLRDRLLGQHVPEPEKLATYRLETQAMLEHEERRLRFVSRFNTFSWVLIVAVSVMFALGASWAADQPPRAYFGVGVTLLLLVIGGAVQLLSGFIGRARLEVVKDIKGLELRIMELESLLRERGRGV